MLWGLLQMFGAVTTCMSVLRRWWRPAAGSEESAREIGGDELSLWRVSREAHDPGN